MSGGPLLYAETSLFGRLVAANTGAWRAYVDHRFVRELGAGTLPEAAFRHYLVQDYLFLIHFARAWGLAVFKARALDDMRAAAAQLVAVLDEELKLHVAFCAEWGLAPDEIENAEEDTATLAYSRYVLERGAAGDLLDLHVALAPCIVGYGEIGRRLAGGAGGGRQANPYRAWIETYGGADYQAVARDAVAALERLAAAAGVGPDSPRLSALARTFGEAARLEAAFWEMGLADARAPLAKQVPVPIVRP